MGERPGTTRLRTLVGNHARLAPIARLLGASVLEVEEGRVVVEFEVREEFKHPGGAVQGGIVTAYADLCMALAAHTHFEQGQHMSTSSLTVNFLAPVTAGPVIGEGTVVKKGRSVVFMEAVVRDREGNDFANASSVGSIRTYPGP
ncbi:MAG TPA: PaaI family thioesterase [Pseudomonadales bacterium]|nr:PaaI family thioesterase [Pseudomonadales bacterium]